MATNRKFINRQQHVTSCGLVALLNVRKWLGRKHTGYRRSMIHFYDLGWDGKGMWARQLSIFLRAMRIKYKRFDYVRSQDIKKAIDDGKSVVLLYAWYNKKSKDLYGAHYVFIDKYTNKSFRAWNWSKSRSEFMPFKELSKCISYSKCHYNKMYAATTYPIMWIIDHD